MLKPSLVPQRVIGRLRPGLLARIALSIVITAASLSAVAAELTENPTQLIQRHWSKADGLPAEFIWAVHQSKDGFLWLATDTGLARFDGLNFKTFGVTTHEAFKSNDIRDVTEGAQGTIWAASVGGGLIRLRDDEIRRFDVSDGLVSNAVYSVAVTSNADVWVGTASGACRLRSEHWQCWTGADGLADGRIIRIAEDQDNRMWFASINDGLSMFDGDEWLTFGVDDGLDSPQVVMLVPDAELNVLAGTLAGGLYRASASGIQSVERGTLPGDLKPFNALRDRDNNILIGMFGSLWQFYPQIRRLDNPDDNISYVTDIAEDRDGGLWVASSTGLYQYHVGAFVPYGKPEGLADETFVVAPGADGSVWAGTELDGAIRVTADGSVQKFTTEHGLPTNAVSSLMVDENGIVWLGTFGGGIVLLQDGEVLSVINSELGLVGEQIGSIYKDRAGAVWIGTDAGLNRWTGGEVTHSWTIDNGLLANLVRNISEDHRGRLLLSGDNGLTILSTDSLEVVDTINSADGLANDAVATTYVDTRGVVWIGGRSGGLARLDGDTLFRFDQHHNVSLTSVMTIIEDEQAQLWLGGRDGIVRISKAELEAVADGDKLKVSLEKYSGNDGLRSTRVSGGYQSASTRTTDGRLWFATTRGLVAIDTTTLEVVGPPPQIRIEEIRVDGTAISAAPPFRIPAGAESVEIDYTVASLNAADKLRFRYRVADSRWLDAGERRTAFFTSLPPRRNVFEVGVTYDGQLFADEQGQKTTIELFVEPRWYQTHIARALAAVSLLVLAWACYGLALRRYRAQQKHLENLVGERTVALQDALEEVEKMSRTDSLTGVANRRHFEERMREEWARAIRNEQPISMMMIDIDYFKQFNDSAGHQAGDACLAAVAQALTTSVREEDFVARYGGEEFSVLLLGSDVDAMCMIGKRLQDCVRSMNLQHPGLPDGAIVTVSAGFATAKPATGDNAEELIRRADEALYRAKDQGRDRIVVDRPYGQDSLTITGALSLGSV